VPAKPAWSGGTGGRAQVPAAPTWSGDTGGRAQVPAAPTWSGDTGGRAQVPSDPGGRVPDGAPGGRSEAARWIDPPADDPRRAGPGPQQPPGDPGPARSGGPAGARPAEPRRRRRTGLLAALAAVLVLALATAGLVVVRPGPVADWLGSDDRKAAADPPEPAPQPVLAAVGSAAPVPTADGIRAAVDRLVTGSGLGPRVNVAVLDVATGQSLYEHGAQAPTVPASTTKLLTAAAVLAARGPAYRLATRAVAGAEPGEVVLVGGGDPTLAVGATGSYPGAARLDTLAEQVKKALGGTAPTRVTVDATLYSGPVTGPGWDADIPTGGFGGEIRALTTDGARVDPKKVTGFAERFSSPDLAAGRSFAKLLGLPTDAVSRGRAPAGAGPAAGDPTAAPASPGGTGPGAELGRVESPPMIRLVDYMLGASDNFVAEALARQVALAKGKPASFQGAAEAVKEQIAALGLPADDLTLADGSGLSRTNRIPPLLLAKLVAMSADDQHPQLGSIIEGLPVGGWSGTLLERFTDSVGTAAGAGVVRAKTGTLSAVNSIAGVVTTADGRLLAFAVLADRVPLGPEQAQTRLDRIATALSGCGCR
jgi:D-alanyl-D-alanine carboxypeptidase/D-alanyl-D-alanine-endopeptidase (penicillin-binding protein 4)